MRRSKIGGCSDNEEIPDAVELGGNGGLGLLSLA